MSPLWDRQSSNGRSELITARGWGEAANVQKFKVNLDGLSPNFDKRSGDKQKDVFIIFKTVPNISLTSCWTSCLVGLICNL